MLDLSIYIRTCTYRQEESLRLKSILEKHHNYKVHLVDCEKQKNYSEAFVVNLSALLEEEKSKSILILEDDMLVSRKWEQGLIEIKDLGIPFCWLSIPNDKIYHHSIPLQNEIHSVSYVSYYYSGAIFVRTSVIKDYCSFYLNEHLSFAEKQFDVTFSQYLCSEIGHFFFRGGLFATDQTLETTFQPNKCSVKEFRLDTVAEDPGFDFSNVLV